MNDIGASSLGLLKYMPLFRSGRDKGDSYQVSPARYFRYREGSIDEAELFH